MPFDANNATHLTQLANELNNDPNSYGYASVIPTGADGLLAQMLNHIRDGVIAPPSGATGSAITVRRQDINPTELFEAIDTRDLASPTGNPTTAQQLAWQAQMSYFEGLASLRTISLLNLDGTNTRILRNIRDILQNPGTQGSRARVDVLVNRNGSRAEQLWGTNSVISDSDIARALRG